MDSPSDPSFDISNQLPPYSVLSAFASYPTTESDVAEYLYPTTLHSPLPLPSATPSLEGTPSRDDENEEGKTSPTRRKRQPKLESCSEDQIVRRRAQNRKSQKAYRARRELQLQGLMDKIDEVELKNEKLQKSYESLRHEVASLRTKFEGAVRMSSGNVSPYDSLSLQGIYPGGGNQGYMWGARSAYGPLIPFSVE